MNYYPTSKIVGEQRFGFGPRLGQTAYYSPLEQLDKKPFVHQSIHALPTTESILITVGENREQRKKAKGDEQKMQAMKKEAQSFLRTHYQQQAQARHLQSVETPYGFQERIIQFWSNHFAISVDNRKLMPLAASIENDVIRQHWNGNFSDMLMASSKHPAMLLYLDNQLSIGPNSKVGKRRDKGLNENLAREILELHTLGVDGSYTQQDVIALAKAISGWGIKFQSPNAGFRFANNLHEPGSITLLGKSYSQSGISQGESCLQTLATHKDTAKHLVDKLCQHFIGDMPKDLSEQMVAAYLKGNGDLLPVYRLLLGSKEANEPKPNRFRPPKEWLFAVLRSADIPLNDKQALNTLNTLGQPPFKPGSPAGWSDQDRDYNSPSALTQRMQVANRLASIAIKSAKASGTKPKVVVDDVIAALYGDAIDEHTQIVLSKADSAAMQLSLLWLSPQFQYR
ncbi:DUF1800 domain-containing protein [Vibrio sp. Sgm 22]|uniref:DUF1800 domain-containing protein n=1 Tax=unclassified Vibrio TaxID=2614977 RepID=UPI0022489339|nr:MULTISPECIES: DUF1800 domain-containing protein [unclassified Vibrio]MCX2760644.1 DUF1800 domain-containing protein [Vibrio sp. 14G-20]MCX2777664.1 DUF1800 domain-containing protein [Vibrio sp. Sgm 22]